MNIREQFNKLFDEFVFGSHILAIDAIAMTLSISLLSGQPINTTILLIPYFLTLVIYSYNHIREIRFDLRSNPERAKLFNKNVISKELTLIIYLLVLLILLVTTNVEVFLLTVLILIAGISYTEKFKMVKIIGFKNIYVSLFWVLIILIVPLQNNLRIDSFYLLVLLIYFLTALASTIFFDIKDVESDDERGLKTLPVVFGLKNTKLLLNIIKIVSMVLVLFGIVLNILPKIFFLYMIAIIYGIIYINKGMNLQNKRLRMVSYLVSDAEFIFWTLVLILAKLLF